MLDHAQAAITDIMKLFAPDGGFEEGPTYWLYATAYNLMYIDALDTALGTDFGVSNAEGFDRTGDYHIQADGPTYLLSNFGDAGMGGAISHRADVLVRPPFQQALLRRTRTRHRPRQQEPSRSHRKTRSRTQPL